MAHVKLTKKQIVSIIQQLNDQELMLVEKALKERKGKSKQSQPSFRPTNYEALRKLVGIGRSGGGKASEEHDKYIYRKDW